MSTISASVGLVGFEGKERDTLEVFFSSSEAHGLVLDVPEKSDALIVNIDGPDSLHSFLRWSERQEARPVVVVVDGIQVPDTLIRLDRPLTMLALKQALKSVRNQLRYASPKTDDKQGPGGAADKKVATTVLDPQAFRSLINEAVAADAAEKARKLQQVEAVAKKEPAANEPAPKQAAPKKAPVAAPARPQAVAARAAVDSEPARAAAPALVLEEPHDQAKAEVEPSAPEPVATDGTHALTWSPAQQVELIKHCCGSLPDLDLSLESGRRRLTINLEGRLLVPVQDAVKQACANQQPVQICGVPGALIYFPAQDSFSYDLDPELLLQMSGTRFAFGELSLMPRPDLEQPQSPMVPRDELVWMLALMTTQGRVPEGVSVDKPLQLGAMPDFTRLLAMPHGKSIATLWMAAPQSALGIVRTLGIAQRFVFSFLVAADATGLFERK